MDSWFSTALPVFSSLRIKATSFPSLEGTYLWFIMLQTLNCNFILILYKLIFVGEIYGSLFQVNSVI